MASDPVFGRTLILGANVKSMFHLPYRFHAYPPTVRIHLQMTNDKRQMTTTPTIPLAPALR